MKKLTKMILGSLLLCLALTFNIGALKTGNAGFPGDKPAVIVEPPETIGLAPGNTFTVEIKLYNVTTGNVPAGLYGVEVKLEWNGAILECVSHTHKLGAAGGVLNPPILIGKNERGTNYVWVAGSTSYPADPWWGTGTIVTLTLRVVGIGRTALQLTIVDLVDYDVNPVPFYKADGLFDNRPPIHAVDIYVDPARVVNSSLTPCNNFTVAIKVRDVVDLSLFSFNLGFNKTVLEAVEAHWFLPPTQPEPMIYNDEGVVNGTAIINPPFTGSTTLVTITFHVLDIGESNLRLYGLYLMNAWGEEIPHNPPGDGYFNNMLITRLFVYPPERIDFTLRPGNITFFDIMIENAIDVRSIEFKLVYNKAVIKCIGAIAIPPTPETLVELQLTINNTVGMLWANITYAPLLNTLPPKSIMTVFFQIVGYGVSPLDLQDTNISDQYGNPVSHQSEDGLLITVIRDVAIVDILPVPQKVYPGRIVTIYVTAQNKGNLTETFDVSAYVDIDTLLGTQTVTDLPPGENITLTFYWDTAGQESCHWHTLWANASIVPYEYDVTNNLLIGPLQVKIKLLGDIDGDGTVGLSDLVLLAQAYGSKPGDPNWNPEADLDNNGKVSLTDLVTLAARYGRTC